MSADSAHEKQIWDTVSQPLASEGIPERTDYEIVTEAIEESLSECIRPDDVAECAIYAEAVERAGTLIEQLRADLAAARSQLADIDALRAKEARSANHLTGQVVALRDALAAARSLLREAQQDSERLTNERDEMIRIGALFSNVAFNFAQGPHSADFVRYRETLDRLRLQWDAARDRWVSSRASKPRESAPSAEDSTPASSPTPATGEQES